MTDTMAVFLAYTAVMLILAIIAKKTWARMFLLALWVCAYVFTAPTNIQAATNDPILPDEFILVAAVVQEPRGNYPGQIWLWARTKEDPLSPQSFSLPYDRDAAQVVREWVKKIGGGKVELGIDLNVKET